MSDTNQTMVKYVVGSILIIAGGVLFYIGKTSEGIAVAGIGLTVLGYSFGEKTGFKKATKNKGP